MFLGHLDDFLFYLSSERGLSKHTLLAYKRDLTFFGKYLEASSLDEVKECHIIRHLELMQKKLYASSSIYRALMAIKMFFRFLKDEATISSNPTKLLDSPKLWQIIPDVLTESEIEALFNKIDQNSEVGLRDLAMFEVLYATGIRVSELCSLSLTDVSEGVLKVMGKGGKERLVPIAKASLQVVDRYLSLYRNDEIKDLSGTPLFVTKKGKRMDRNTVYQRLKVYACQAKLMKKVTPHTLRHTFATHLLDHGADLRVIQEMLGHADIATTDRYTHISSTSLSKNFSKYHPRTQFEDKG